MKEQCGGGACGRNDVAATATATATLLATLLIAVLLLTACGGTLSTKDERARLSQLHVQLASAYLAEGRLAVALEEARAGLDYNPRNAEAHQVMGLVRQRLGEPEQARSSLREALALAPGNPRYMAQYATFLCRLGEYDEALALFDRVNREPLNEAPAATRARSGGCRLRAGDLAGAERDFLQALSLQAAIPAVLLSMADIQYRRRLYVVARRWLQQYFAVAPETPDSLHLGARIGRALGDVDMEKQHRRRLRAAWPYSTQLQALEQQLSTADP